MPGKGADEGTGDTEGDGDLRSGLPSGSSESAALPTSGASLCGFLRELLAAAAAVADWDVPLSAAHTALCKALDLSAAESTAARVSAADAVGVGDGGERDVPRRAGSASDGESPSCSIRAETFAFDTGPSTPAGRQLADAPGPGPGDGGDLELPRPRPRPGDPNGDVRLASA